MSYRKRRQPVEKGIPALVAIPNGKTVTIKGKVYRLLELKYDLKGEYMPPAMLRP